MELVATCLIKVADCVKGSPGKLSELYGHGLINRATHLIDINSRITLSQSTYTVSYDPFWRSSTANVSQIMFALEDNSGHVSFVIF